MKVNEPERHEQFTFNFATEGVNFSDIIITKHFGLVFTFHILFGCVNTFHDEFRCFSQIDGTRHQVSHSVVISGISPV